MDNHENLEQNGVMALFPGLASQLFFHGIFNRHGGVSPPPWDSRNISYHLGDELLNVAKNRKRMKKSLGCTALVSARQVHGSRIYRVREYPGADLEVDGYDALITDIEGLGLMIQQADCQAVMLLDPVKKAAGIIHAGWRGTIAGIVAKTVAAMNLAFATDPADVTAGISPSLGPCCAEFVNYRKEIPADLHRYQVRPDYFDFWAISRDQLRAAGLRPERIYVAEVCTCCSPDYFSYRRDGKTGRFASVLGLKSRKQDDTGSGEINCAGVL